MTRLDPGLLDPARYPFAFRVTTRFSDVDLNAHINNLAIGAAFEDARARFAWHADPPKALTDCRIVLRSAEYDYLAELFYPRSINIAVGVLAIGRTSYTIGQLAMQGGQAKAYCRAIQVFSDGSHALPVPGEYREWLQKMLVKV